MMCKIQPAQRNAQVICRVIGDQSVQHPKESNRDMSLDDQKAQSGCYLEAPDAASAAPGARENGKIRFEFKATDFVVYPAHGVGQILSIEEQTVAGASLEVFVIFFRSEEHT